MVQMMEQAHFLVVILCVFLLTMLYLWLLHVRAALMWLYYGPGPGPLSSLLSHTVIIVTTRSQLIDKLVIRPSFVMHHSGPQAAAAW